MALPPLATPTDLLNRGVVIDEPLASTMLGVASSLVREACNGPVLETTSTVAISVLDDSQWLDLPGAPVTAVSAVSVDGNLRPGTSYQLHDGRLYSPSAYWRTRWSFPSSAVVTLTHGMAEVPDYIVQLVCDLAILGASSSTEGASDPRVVVESIDDYKVTFSDKGQLVSSAMTLPEATRRALRTRFGGGVDMVPA